MQLSTQTIGMFTGAVLSSAVVARGLLLAVRSRVATRRRRRRLDGRREEFCRSVAATAQAARASKAVAEWEGWRPFRVAAIVDEALDVKSFYFSPVDGRPLAPFGPGQYLTFRLPLPGREEPLVRCYSLSEHPREDYYRCTVKLVPAPDDRPELPAGLGSSYFHEQVAVGDLLDVRAPAGTFLIDPLENRPVVLIGAGIGVTPLVSMLSAIVRTGRRRKVYALLGFRNGGEHPFKERLESLAAEHPNIHLHISYSSPTAEDELYRDFIHEGRIDIAWVQEMLPANNFHFYVCGPGSMMASLVPALWDWGVPESHVHYEAFGPASVKRVAGSHDQPITPCKVRFENAGRDVTWDGSHGSLLELGEASGIRLPSGCRAGSCGECLAAIREGEVTTLKEPGIPVPDGHCLTCISVPTGRLVLGA